MDQGHTTVSASRPGSADKRGLSLLVMMPALNEDKTIGDVIDRIPRQIAGIRSVRVLVVNDGSTDQTAERAAERGATVLHHPRPLGVGAAFKTALTHALATDADLLVSIDSDGQFDPATIPALIAPVVAGQADFATASRFADPALTPKMPGLKRWGNRMMSRLVSRLVKQRFHDVSCGMRCYNRRAAMSLNTIGAFTYTQEVFLNLGFKGLRMVEVPIAVRGERAHGRSRVASNLWRYAVNTSAIIFRCYRDYNPMRFFGRLALGLILPAVALELFLLVHYLRTGSFSPHKWAGFTGGAMVLLGLLLLQLGIIGDMLNRHRIYLEELLFQARGNNRPGLDRRPDDSEAP